MHQSLPISGIVIKKVLTFDEHICLEYIFENLTFKIRNPLVREENRRTGNNVIPHLDVNMTSGGEVNDFRGLPTDVY